MTPQEQISHIADVRVEVEVQLDQRWMKLSEILDSCLWQHSLNYSVRRARNILTSTLGSRLLAFGEIVIVENIMGVRVDLPPQHRRSTGRRPPTRIRSHSGAEPARRRALFSEEARIACFRTIARKIHERLFDSVLRSTTCLLSAGVLWFDPRQ